MRSFARGIGLGGEILRTGDAASLLHRLGFWTLDAREVWSPTVRWPLHLAARLHRRLHAEVPLVIVSGSNGKTTTTGLIARILESRFSVIARRDNRNSDTRFHRYVFRSRRGAGQVLVLECGIQRPGNAERWNRVIDPDVLVLTNIDDTHLAWLGSREGVLAGKLALARNLKPGGTVVLNADDPLLAAARPAARVPTFAVGGPADFVAREVRAGYGLTLRLRHFTNVTTVYAHLRRVLVRRGRVARGRRIAASGRSGIFRSGNEYDYPHLHFEVRVDGLPVDPARYWPELVAGIDP